MIAINDNAKCAGQDNTGNNVCSDRERCGRYLRPTGDYQTWEAFWKAGRDCQWYESIAGQSDWNESRIDVIGQNGNTGDHYA